MTAIPSTHTNFGWNGFCGTYREWAEIIGPGTVRELLAPDHTFDDEPSEDTAERFRHIAERRESTRAAKAIVEHEIDQAVRRINATLRKAGLCARHEKDVRNMMLYTMNPERGLWG